MGYPHNLYAEVDLEHPVQFGICDRCGFLYNLSDMPFQYDQRGNSVQNIHLRVCSRTCLDEVATILKPIIIVGPEGVGLPDPRPTNYAAKMASTGPQLPFLPANPMAPVIEVPQLEPIDGTYPQKYEPGQPGI